MIVTMTNRFTDIVIAVRHIRVVIIFSVTRANHKKRQDYGIREFATFFSELVKSPLIPKLSISL